MKILLICPSPSGRERYGKLARSGTYLPPLGLAYLAAVVEDRHEVRILDGSVSDCLAPGAFAGELAAFRPDLVGITVMTPTVGRSLELFSIVKEVAPHAVTVAGGPHATAVPHDLLRIPSVDIVVVGEGEKTFRELVDLLAEGADISACAGIGYKRKHHVFFTATRSRNVDLDGLPFPARHLLPMERYRPSVLHYRQLPAMSVMCSRGCPYLCTFCSCSKVFREAVTWRSPENVVAEIRHLKDRYQAREILLWDDNFGLSRAWTEEFCARIKPLQLSWSAWMRVDRADRETLNLMAASGCWHVSYGVESGNQKVLDAIRKGFTLDQAKTAFRLTHEAGMEARGTFIFGLPYETLQTMRETLRFAIELEADYAQFQLMTPYPGTEFWDTVSQYGTLDTSDLSKYTIWFPVFVPRGLTREELVQAHRSAHRSFYFRPTYLLQRVLRLRSWEDVKRNGRGFLSLLEHTLPRKD